MNILPGSKLAETYRGSRSVSEGAARGIAAGIALSKSSAALEFAESERTFGFRV